MLKWDTGACSEETTESESIQVENWFISGAGGGGGFLPDRLSSFCQQPLHLPARAPGSGSGSWATHPSLGVPGGQLCTSPRHAGPAALPRWLSLGGACALVGKGFVSSSSVTAMKYFSELHSHCFTQDAAFYSGLVSAHRGESMGPFTLQVSRSDPLGRSQCHLH